LRIAVEDRGEGVPPHFVPDLFERFTRVEGREREPVGGTGLGLAIARSYARAHDGDLVYEEAEPHGARFQLVLPARQPNGDANGRNGDELAEGEAEVEGQRWRLFGRRR
jgi:two-component system OmpR family sensor kinase